MSYLAKYLSPINIKLEDILLDPNNPRFAELGEDIIVVPYNRYNERTVQKKAYEKMRD
ncbi:hypothetical protein MCHI_001385, partial [Candidatus Magnetoovum chiemensis]